MNKSSLAFGTLLATIGFVLSPAVTAPFMGYTTDQLPLAIENPPIQPAGYAFSIWGVIYLWLLVSALFGVFKRRNALEWHKARLPLFVSLALGMFWLWIAGQSAIWGTVSIWIMSITALMALRATPDTDRWWLRAPVALYAGWLSAASFVSLGVTLAGYGLLFGWVTWSLIGLCAALLWSIYNQVKTPKAPEYSIAVIWAFVGIVIGNWGADTSVAILAGVCAAIMSFNTIRSATS